MVVTPEVLMTSIGGSGHLPALGGTHIERVKGKEYKVRYLFTQLGCGFFGISEIF